MKDYPKIEVASVYDLRTWLEQNHQQTGSIWLVHGKRAAGSAYLPYNAIVEEALAFGWIDSLPRALDASRTMILLSPRKAHSAWSRPNRERVAKLIAEGRMHPAGQAKVDAAKSDGSWTLLDTAEAGIVPDDLADALALADARKGYDQLSDAARRRIIEYVLRAKRTETRAVRIGKIVAAAKMGADPLAWTPRDAR